MKAPSETRKLTLSLASKVTDSLFRSLIRHYCYYPLYHYINVRYSSVCISSRIHNKRILVSNSYKPPSYRIMNTFGDNYNTTDHNSRIRYIVPRTSHPRKNNNTFANNEDILPSRDHNRIRHRSLVNLRTSTFFVD